MATKGTVSGVIANMVTLTVDGPVAQNEICYILTGGDRLMAEVIKVVGSNVYVQVFESTRGLKVGAEAEFTGHMLEVTLGPGMLSKNYDGLQNDLDKMDGVFLKRGQPRLRSCWDRNQGTPEVLCSETVGPVLDFPSLRCPSRPVPHSFCFFKQGFAFGSCQCT